MVNAGIAWFWWLCRAIEKVFAHI